MPDIKIFPSLLSANAGAFQVDIDKMDAYCDAIHFDVMDGQFVPNLSFGAGVMQHLTTSSPLGFDAHLMVEQPDILIDDFAKAGCSSLSVHVEVLPHIHKTLQSIQAKGMKAGVVLNPGTSFAFAEEAIAMADYVLVMSVNPGFGGQKFIPAVLDKVRAIRAAYPEKDIQIDGGITNETAPLAIEAGANWLVSGSYLFGAENLEEAVQSLKG